MTQGQGPLSLRRVLVTLVLVAGLGGLTVVLVLAYLDGWSRSAGSILDPGRYLGNLEITSLWWFAAGIITWLGTLFLLRFVGGRFSRSMGFVLGPGAALWVVFSWVLSFLMYGFRVWSVDGRPTGLRWVLDGAVMNGWRSFATLVLGRFDLPAALSPVHFVDSAPWKDARGGAIALGLVNEATLALMLGTVLVLVAACVVRVARGPKRLA